MNVVTVETEPCNYEYPLYNNQNSVNPLFSYQFNLKQEYPNHRLNDAQANCDSIHQESIIQSNNQFQEVPFLDSKMGIKDNLVTSAPKTYTELHSTSSDKKITPSIKPLLVRPRARRKIKKEKGKTSNYWSQKITDADFKFYGCALCPVSYLDLNDLVTHIATHKDRITSYDIKVRKQNMKKKLKKQKKKLKKCDPVKKELDVEIKPEEGYIGNEKALDYESKSSESVSKNENSENISNNTESNLNNDQNSVSNGENKTESIEKNVDQQTAYNLERMFKCIACNKQFSLGYYLKLHVRSHTDEKPYMCSECGQSFITASKLGRHKKRTHLAVKYQCRICYMIFTRFENLTRHFDKRHPDDKLEGEPYDYNAILPYLKEVEEQLKEKEEKEKVKSDVTPVDEKEFVKVEDASVDTKPKTEGLWEGVWPQPEVVEALEDPPQRDTLELEAVKLTSCDVTMDFEVKAEPEEPVSCGEEPMSPLPDEPDRNESSSEEDYFPSNTWISEPKLDSPIPPSPPEKRKYTRHNREGPITCEICNKEIRSPSYLRVHMRTHTGEKPFKCYVCSRGFITSSKMHRHALTHTETWDDTIKTDDKKEIKSENDEPCDEGKSKTIKKTKDKLKKKRKLKNKEEKREKRPYKLKLSCEYCHKKFLHEETLNVHKKSHKEEELVLKCTFCLSVFEDECSLKSHETTHVGPKPFMCTICGKCYKKKETMMYHRKNHKPGDTNQFSCEICRKTFSAQCKLQRHRVAHGRGQFSVKYECPVCAHLFHTKYHVEMHLNTHQREGLINDSNRGEILAMVLQNARKIPKNPNAVIDIDNLIPNTEEKSRICNICGEIFQHFFYLEEHLKSHGNQMTEEKEEERKHICPVCKKGFKLHYYLKLHSFTHTKEKPFICQQCGKGFITKGKLKRHLETHSGLKKYQCHVCYKFFTRPSYLRIHVRTIHGTQDYNFKVVQNYGEFDCVSQGSE